MTTSVAGPPTTGTGRVSGRGRTAGEPTAQEAAVTRIVRHHLRAFLEEQDLDALMGDYHEDARFCTAARTYLGTEEIRGFFEGFVAALPPDGIEQFRLESLRVAGSIGYITWSLGAQNSLGTDTFVVDGDRILAQTFAMYAAPHP